MWDPEMVPVLMNLGFQAEGIQTSGRSFANRRDKHMNLDLRVEVDSNSKKLAMGRRACVDEPRPRVEADSNPEGVC